MMRSLTFITKYDVAYNSAVVKIIVEDYNIAYAIPFCFFREGKNYSGNKSLSVDCDISKFQTEVRDSLSVCELSDEEMKTIVEFLSDDNFFSDFRTLNKDRKEEGDEYEEHQ